MAEPFVLLVLCPFGLISLALGVVLVFWGRWAQRNWHTADGLGNRYIASRDTLDQLRGRESAFEDVRANRAITLLQNVRSTLTKSDNELGEVRRTLKSLRDAGRLEYPDEDAMEAFVYSHTPNVWQIPETWWRLRALDGKLVEVEEGLHSAETMLAKLQDSPQLLMQQINVLRDIDLPGLRQMATGEQEAGLDVGLISAEIDTLFGNLRETEANLSENPNAPVPIIDEYEQHIDKVKEEADSLDKRLKDIAANRLQLDNQLATIKSQLPPSSTDSSRHWQSVTYFTDQTNNMLRLIEGQRRTLDFTNAQSYASLAEQFAALANRFRALMPEVDYLLDIEMNAAPDVQAHIRHINNRVHQLLQATYTVRSQEGSLVGAVHPNEIQTLDNAVQTVEMLRDEAAQAREAHESALLAVSNEADVTIQTAYDVWEELLTTIQLQGDPLIGRIEALPQQLSEARGNPYKLETVAKSADKLAHDIATAHDQLLQEHENMEQAVANATAMRDEAVVVAGKWNCFRKTLETIDKLFAQIEQLQTNALLYGKVENALSAMRQVRSLTARIDTFSQDIAEKVGKINTVLNEITQIYTALRKAEKELPDTIAQMVGMMYERSHTQTEFQATLNDLIQARNYAQRAL